MTWSDYTTQEYLLNSKFAAAHFPHPSYLSVSCMTYLLISSKIHWPNKDSFPPFLHYAAEFWGKHLHQIGATRRSSTTNELALKLLQSKPAVQLLGDLLWVFENASALHLCSYFGLDDMLESVMTLTTGLLLNVNSQNAHGCTPLYLGAQNGHEDIVRLLLGRDDVDVNLPDAFGSTPVFIAAYRGHDKIVKLLIEREDVNINSRDGDGWTPLMAAAFSGCTAIVQLLLTREDVQVNASDAGGQTALFIAAENEDEGSGTVRLLVERDDVDVNSRDKGGWTPLLLAADWGHEAVVRSLLARDDLDGVDVNLMDNHGQTPLIAAASNGYEGVVQLLLARDTINIHAVNDYGQTALLAATQKGHTNIVRMLRLKEF